MQSFQDYLRSIETSLFAEKKAMDADFVLYQRAWEDFVRRMNSIMHFTGSSGGLEKKFKNLINTLPQTGARCPRCPFVQLEVLPLSLNDQAMLEFA